MVGRLLPSELLQPLAVVPQVQQVQQVQQAVVEGVFHPWCSHQLLRAVHPLVAPLLLVQVLHLSVLRMLLELRLHLVLVILQVVVVRCLHVQLLQRLQVFVPAPPQAHVEVEEANRMQQQQVVQLQPSSVWHLLVVLTLGLKLHQPLVLPQTAQMRFLS